MMKHTSMVKSYFVLRTIVRVAFVAVHYCFEMLNALQGLSQSQW